MSGRDRGSTQAVDAVLTVFTLVGLAVVLPSILTMMALGVEASPDDVGAITILGFWSLIVVTIVAVGRRYYPGGGA